MSHAVPDPAGLDPTGVGQPRPRPAPLGVQLYSVRDDIGPGELGRTGSGPDAGTRFPVMVDTHLSVLTRFRSGVVGTSIYSFDSAVRRQRFEITGEHGVLRVPVSGCDDPPALLRSGEPDADSTNIPPFGESRDRGVGVLEMARAIRAGQPPRASGELAYHVLDVMLAIEEPAGWSAAAATLGDRR